MEGQERKRRDRKSFLANILFLCLGLHAWLQFIELSIYLRFPTCVSYFTAKQGTEVRIGKQGEERKEQRKKGREKQAQKMRKTQVLGFGRIWPVGLSPLPHTPALPSMWMACMGWVGGILSFSVLSPSSSPL